MSGVTIGNGAVIGLRSVVTHDVEPYTVVAGAPATRRKYRFAPDVIARLQKAAWWDWPPEKVKAHGHLLASDRLEEFFKVAGV